MNKIIHKKIDKAVRKGRVEAIVKDIAGKRMLVGFSRNRRSRKRGTIFMTTPIILDSQ